MDANQQDQCTPELQSPAQPETDQIPPDAGKPIPMEASEMNRIKDDLKLKLETIYTAFIQALQQLPLAPVMRENANKHFDDGYVWIRTALDQLQLAKVPMVAPTAGEPVSTPEQSMEPQQGDAA